MASLDLTSLESGVAEVAGPFLEELVAALAEDIISVAIVGTAVTPGYVPGEADINSLVVVKELGVQELHAIAPLGKRYGRKGVAAPFLLTPAVIDSSLDVFPLEFLDFSLAHKTVYGPDLLSVLEVEREHLRLQVERELKTYLMQLRQGFIRCAGEARLLGEVLSEASREIFPAVRALLHLSKRPISLVREKDLEALCEALGIGAASVKSVLLGGSGKGKPSLQEVEARFTHLYAFVQALSEKADAGLG